MEFQGFYAIEPGNLYYVLVNYFFIAEQIYRSSHLVPTVPASSPWLKKKIPCPILASRKTSYPPQSQQVAIVLFGGSLVNDIVYY